MTKGDATGFALATSVAALYVGGARVARRSAPTAGAQESVANSAAALSVYGAGAAKR